MRQIKYLYRNIINSVANLLVVTVQYVAFLNDYKSSSMMMSIIGDKSYRITTNTSEMSESKNIHHSSLSSAVQYEMNEKPFAVVVEIANIGLIRKLEIRKIPLMVELASKVKLWNLICLDRVLR